MKKITKVLTSLAVFLILVVPALSLAQTNTGLIPCGNTGQPACDFNSLLDLINKVVLFILKYMVVPIAAIMFAYAGFETVTSGGSTEKRGLAKKVFANTVIGLCLAAGAWIIIRTILSILGYEGSWIGF